MPAGLVENSLSLVEEKAKSGSGPVVYRITVGTKQESADNAATNSPWSTHKFQINIEGVGGQKTGNMQIRYYAPSLSYGAASGVASWHGPNRLRAKHRRLWKVSRWRWRNKVRRKPSWPHPAWPDRVERESWRTQ